MVHKRMAATFRRHRTSLSAGAHMYMSSLLLTACAVLLCPAGLTKMVSKLSKEGAYKKGLEVRRHNKAAVLQTKPCCRCAGMLLLQQLQACGQGPSAMGRSTVSLVLLSTCQVSLLQVHGGQQIQSWTPNHSAPPYCRCIIP